MGMIKSCWTKGLPAGHTAQPETLREFCRTCQKNGVPADLDFVAIYLWSLIHSCGPVFNAWVGLARHIPDTRPRIGGVVYGVLPYSLKNGKSIARDRARRKAHGLAK
ncbi:MAG: hypothetical protein H3C30_18205 [Candidatus Hydrogenedentes bacterium]|nr:hypothetical protein [Candidatus Hydrogenedentota bacterium]